MEIKKTLIITFAVLFLVTNSIMVSAITGSMGNARMILYPEVNGWTNTVIEKSIDVTNVNNISINITLVPDANATKFIDVIDKTFILQPGEEKKAQFEVKVKKVGTYQGQINVFFKPENGSQGGVVLSSTIIVVAKKNQGYSDNETDTNTNTNTNTNSTNINTDKNNTQGPSKLIKIWGLSTLILLVILLILLYIWSKKRNKNKKRKNR